MGARVFVEVGLAQLGLVSVLAIARPAMVERVSIEYAAWQSLQALFLCCMALLVLAVFGAWMAVWPSQTCSSQKEALLSSSLASSALVALAIAGFAIGCGFFWSRIGDAVVIGLSLAVGILSASVVRAVPHVLACCCCSPDLQSVRAATACSSEVGVAAHRATVRSQQESGDYFVDVEFSELVSELTALSD